MFLYLAPISLICLGPENDLSIIKYFAPAATYDVLNGYQLYKPRGSRGLALAAIILVYFDFFNKKTSSLLNISI